MKVSKPKAISSAHAILKVFRFGYVSMRTYFERGEGGGGRKKAGRALRGDLRELLLGFYLTNPLQTRRINELLYQKRKILSYYIQRS